MPDRSHAPSKTGEHRRIELGEPANPPHQEPRPQPVPERAEEPQFKTGVLPIVPELLEDHVPRENNAPDSQRPR